MACYNAEKCNSSGVSEENREKPYSEYSITLQIFDIQNLNVPYPWTHCHNIRWEAQIVLYFKKNVPLFSSRFLFRKPKCSPQSAEMLQNCIYFDK
jgi:hypothetical protein